MTSPALLRKRDAVQFAEVAKQTGVPVLVRKGDVEIVFGAPTADKRKPAELEFDGEIRL